MSLLQIFWKWAMLNGEHWICCNLAKISTNYYMKLLCLQHLKLFSQLNAAFLFIFDMLQSCSLPHSFNLPRNEVINILWANYRRAYHTICSKILDEKVLPNFGYMKHMLNSRKFTPLRAYGINQIHEIVLIEQN